MYAFGVCVLAMKFVQAIWRSILNAWLVSASLIILVFLLVGVPVLLAAVHAIAERVSGLEAADTLLMDIIMWASVLVFVLTPIGFAIYGTVRVARWLLNKK